MPQNENSSLLYTQVEKAMATHSSTLAWKIPWTEEPGRLQSMGSRRVRHDWTISLSLFTFMHWRRTWQPTPVFFPGGSQGRGSLVGHHLRGSSQTRLKRLSSSSSSSIYPGLCWFQDWFPVQGNFTFLSLFRALCFPFRSLSFFIK